MEVSPTKKNGTTSPRDNAKQSTTTSCSTGSTQPSPMPQHEQIVKLNVGGKRFCTTTSTMVQSGSNFLSNLLMGRMAAVKDEEGYIFIDRNGANFEIILDYLRNGLLLIPSSIPLKAVVVEAQFYSISLGECQRV